MKRLGTVLTFKPGVSETEAKAALDKIKGLLAEDWLTDGWAKKPTTCSYRIEEYDDKFGGPVWYIP